MIVRSRCKWSSIQSYHYKFIFELSWQRNFSVLIFLNRRMFFSSCRFPFSTKITWRKLTQNKSPCKELRYDHWLVARIPSLHLGAVFCGRLLSHREGKNCLVKNNRTCATVFVEQTKLQQRSSLETLASALVDLFIKPDILSLLHVQVFISDGGIHFRMDTNFKENVEWNLSQSILCRFLWHFFAFNQNETKYDAQNVIKNLRQNSLNISNHPE